MRADIAAAFGELEAAQANGEPPTILVAGSAPGESGVAVFWHRFDGGMHFRNTPGHHLICFQMSQIRGELRMAGVRHEPPAGSLIIHPAGFDWAGRPNFDCERDASGSFKPPDGARRVRAGELGREPLGPMKSESGEERIIEDNRSRRVAH